MPFSREGMLNNHSLDRNTTFCVRKRIEKVLQRFFKTEIHVSLFLKNLVLVEGDGTVLEQIEQLFMFMQYSFRCNLFLIHSCNRFKC